MDTTLYASGVIDGQCGGREDKGGYQKHFICLVQQVGMGILGNVWVCPCLSLPKPGMGLQPHFAGGEERQAPFCQKNAYVWGRGIHTFDVVGLRELESCSGQRGDFIFWGTGEVLVLGPDGLSNWFNLDPGFHTHT